MSTHDSNGSDFLINNLENATSIAALQEELGEGQVGIGCTYNHAEYEGEPDTVTIYVYSEDNHIAFEMGALDARNTFSALYKVACG